MKRTILLYAALFLIASPAMAQAPTSASVNSEGSVIKPGESANWADENAYWQKTYPVKPYYRDYNDYSIYAPAYHYGVDLANLNPGRPFDDLNDEQISSGWKNGYGSKSLSWTEAKPATRDAYNRVYSSRMAASGNPTVSGNVTNSGPATILPGTTPAIGTTGTSNGATISGTSYSSGHATGSSNAKP